MCIGDVIWYFIKLFNLETGIIEVIIERDKLFYCPELRVDRNSVLIYDNEVQDSVHILRYIGYRIRGWSKESTQRVNRVLSVCW